MPAPGYITLAWDSGAIDVLLGDGPPVIEQGYAQFEQIARPKRKGVLEFTGIQLFSMTIPCLFDGWATQTPIDQRCLNIESLCRPPEAQKVRQPTPIKVLGPVPHSELTWYIAGIAWGDAIYDGNVRLRQFFDLSLIEKATMPAVLGNERRQDFRKVKVIVSKTGDLRELAQLVYGESTLWRRFTNIKGKPFRDWRQKKGIKVKAPI